MNRPLAVSLAAFALLAVAAPARAAAWALDPAHTEIGFNVRHMMVTDVHGAFEKYTGTLVVDDKDATKSKIDIVIDVNSVNTKVEKRDTHLKSADFFDAANHPRMTFTSTKVAKGAKPNSYQVTGDLTIRGTTKPVVLEVEVSDEWTDPKEWGGNVHRGVKATAKINRQDFGLKWQTTLDRGGVVAGNEVAIVINAELIKQPPKG